MTTCNQILSQLNCFIKFAFSGVGSLQVLSNRLCLVELSVNCQV